MPLPWAAISHVGSWKLEVGSWKKGFTRRDEEHEGEKLGGLLPQNSEAYSDFQLLLSLFIFLSS
jgi:hypothetical protein